MKGVALTAGSLFFYVLEMRSKSLVSVFLCSNGLLHKLIIREFLKESRQWVDHRGVVERVVIFLSLLILKLTPQNYCINTAYLLILGHVFNEQV